MILHFRQLSFIVFVIFFVIHISCGEPAVITLDQPTKPPTENEADNNENNEESQPHTSSDSSVLEGPASALLIDETVHPINVGYEGSSSGVWGSDFNFRMDNYPVTWAISLAHVSLLLKSESIEYSPDAVLSVAIKESSLKCLEVGFPNDDGCFQIEGYYGDGVYGSAYGELAKLFPDRFPSEPTSHTDLISDEHFETSALAMAYYTLFSMGMFTKYTDDPYGFFENHPDPYAQQKVVSAAYNRGLWWCGLDNIFNNCQDGDVFECFGEYGVTHTGAIDHADAINDYTLGLEAVSATDPFDVELSLEDLQDYWETIKLMYADVDEAAVLEVLEESFNEVSGGLATISFHSKLKGILKDLIEFLPQMPTEEEMYQILLDNWYLTPAYCH